MKRGFVVIIKAGKEDIVCVGGEWWLLPNKESEGGEGSET